MFESKKGSNPKQTKTKKYTPLVLILVVILTLLLLLQAGKTFKKKAEPESQKITLNYWGLFESKEVMDELINKYEKEHPNVDIIYEKRDFDDLGVYRATLLTRLQNKSGPAIFRLHSTWMSQYLNEVSFNNDSITNQDYTDRFYPVVKKQCVTNKGQMLCMPLMYDGLAMIYNKDLLARDSVSVPTTWEELRSAALKLTRKSETGIVQAGVTLGTASNVRYASDIFAFMLNQSNVGIPDGLDSEEGAAALDFYSNFSKMDKSWDNTMPDSISTFATEKAAITFGTASSIRDIFSLNPTINLGVAPMPQLPVLGGGTTDDGWANFWVESVSADLSSDEQKAAWDFLEWMSREDQQTQKYTLGVEKTGFGEIPANKNLYQTFKGINYVGPIVTQAPKAKTLYLTDYAGNGEYVDIIKTAINSNVADKSDESLEVLKTAREAFTKLAKEKQSKN